MAAALAAPAAAQQLPIAESQVVSRLPGLLDSLSRADGSSGVEFLARLITHIPDPGQVMTRCYGWYASRTRGTRARLAHLASNG